MKLTQEPFRKYKTSKKVDAFTVRLNAQERIILESGKKLLNQTKDSTALKQLALIGYNVIHDTWTAKILSLIFKNKKNNQLQGISDFE